MSEFTPAQLDAMEDALEELEELGIPSALRESEDAGDLEAVSRLEQFREILALSHEAFPLEDPPAGVLDAVFAEARASVEAEPVVATPAKEETAQPWWKRLSLLVPALAVAGSAALILVIVTPSSDESAQVVASAEKRSDKARTASAPAAAAAEPAEEGAAEKMVADGRLADAEARREQSEADPFSADELGPRGNALAESKDLQRGRLLDRGDDAPASPAPAAEPMAEEEEADDNVAFEDEKPAERAKSKKRASKGSAATGKKSGGKAFPPPPAKSPAKPKPEPAPQPKADSPKSSPGAGAGGEPSEPDMSVDYWQLLAKADAARRAGSCSAAKANYRKVDKSPDNKARARAFAGIGLCEEAAGKTGVAQKYYSRARSLDGSVSKFIASERPARQQADEPAPQQAQPPNAQKKK